MLWREKKKKLPVASLHVLEEQIIAQRQKAPCCFSTCTKRANHSAEPVPGVWCCDCSPVTNQLHISQRF